MALLKDKANTNAKQRKEIALILREDAERYCNDRLIEIDKEEKDTKTSKDETKQMLLFKTSAVLGFKARRAYVDTFHKRRLEEIKQYEKTEEPPEPQPLGALFVFPPGEKHAT